MLEVPNKSSNILNTFGLSKSHSRGLLRAASSRAWKAEELTDEYARMCPTQDQHGSSSTVAFILAFVDCVVCSYSYSYRSQHQHLTFCKMTNKFVELCQDCQLA